MMFIRFLLVGGAGFVIDAGLTYLLIRFGIEAWLARLPAIVSAAFFTWLANRYFTYRVTAPRSTHEAARYALVAFNMGVINYLIYLLFIHFGTPPVGAVIIATAFQTLVSFYAYRRFAFKLPKKDTLGLP